jgi:hypothetical protein
MMAGRLAAAATCAANDAACGIAPEASIAAAVVCFGLVVPVRGQLPVTARGFGAFLLVVGVFCLAQVGENL